MSSLHFTFILVIFFPTFYESQNHFRIFFKVLYFSDFYLMWIFSSFLNFNKIWNIFGELKLTRGPINDLLHLETTRFVKISRLKNNCAAVCNLKWTFRNQSWEFPYVLWSNMSKIEKNSWPKVIKNVFKCTQLIQVSLVICGGYVHQRV